MSRNALQVTEQAVALWRANHGNESLDQQCQRFDGYYWQWAWAGTERGIVTYSTATAAANASHMYSANINEPSAQPGDLANWWWNPEGHVGTVIGHSGGRVLVSHTSSKGDTVVRFSNNVKISHADTIGLTFRGYSATNGANARRTGLLAWPETTPKPAPIAEEEEEMSRPICVAKTTSGNNVEVTIFSFDTGEEQVFVSTRDKDGHAYNTNVALTYGCAPQVPISYVTNSHYDKIKGENAATRKRLAK